MCYLFSLRSHLVVCLVANLKKLSMLGDKYFLFLFLAEYLFYLFILGKNLEKVIWFEIFAPLMSENVHRRVEW